MSMVMSTLVLLLPARWWPDTLPEFKSGGWWQRPHKRVRCRQCKCSLVENPSFKSSRCHVCKKHTWCEISNITHTCLEYIDYMYKPRFFPPKNPAKNQETKLSAQRKRKKLGIDHQHGQYYEHCKRSTKPKDLKARR